MVGRLVQARGEDPARLLRLLLQDQGDYLIHNLELSEHGLSNLKAWVIIQGAHARAPRLGTATSPRLRERNTSMTYYGRRPPIINKYFYGRG